MQNNTSIYQGYAGATGQGLNFILGNITSRMAKNATRTNYNAFEGQLSNKYNKMLIDFGTSMSETNLGATALYGLEQQLNHMQGVVNVGQKKDYGRKSRLKLLQNKADIESQIVNEQAMALAQARAQNKAITQQQRASALSTAVTMAIMLI